MTHPQARVEVGVLQFLNTRGDPDNKHHIVRMRDFFMHCSHLCLVFELLSVNLYELVKHNQFRGLSMNLLRFFILQVSCPAAPSCKAHSAPLPLIAHAESPGCQVPGLSCELLCYMLTVRQGLSSASKHARA